MRSRLHGRVRVVAPLAFALAAVAALLLSTAGTAQARKAAQQPYTLVDPGTFGGPNSFFDLPATPVTNQGTLLGQADTSTLDSDFPNCFGCGGDGSDPYVQHAFAWENGQLVDPGALPGENSSGIFELNDHGVGAGGSEDGSIDPNTGNAASVAVLFRGGQVMSLGRLPGGHESFAQDINDRGQVAGFSSNGTPDPFSCFLFCWGTQTRGFVWQNGVMHDLGTLGGPDTVETNMNQQGQIVGQSFTNDTPNPTTGLPTMDPFLWTNGHMRDLGSLGGTFGGVGDQGLNERGEVAGTSNLAGDQISHPYLWDGTTMIDLGTLGGDNGSANAVNDDGDVVGSADLPSGTHDGYLWKNGVMHDLPPVNGAPCSNAEDLNARDEVVGNATDCHGHELAAVLWKDGNAIDLNSVIAPSPLRLTTAEYVSKSGEIVGKGELPNADQRVFLLIPNNH
jgi:probable HAF family extracellular repeat protein